MGADLVPESFMDHCFAQDGVSMASQEAQGGCINSSRRTPLLLGSLRQAKAGYPRSPGTKGAESAGDFECFALSQKAGKIQWVFQGSGTLQSSARVRGTPAGSDEPIGFYEPIVLLEGFRFMIRLRISGKNHDPGSVPVEARKHPKFGCGQSHSPRSRTACFPTLLQRFTPGFGRRLAAYPGQKARLLFGILRQRFLRSQNGGMDTRGLEQRDKSFSHSNKARFLPREEFRGEWGIQSTTPLF
jgi:hypothetical protein